jgi:hypothetical protein
MSNNPNIFFHEILQVCVLRHLGVLPGSTFQFDRNLADACNLLKDTIFPANTPSPSLGAPAVSHSSAIRDTDKKVADHINEYRLNFVTAVCGETRNCGLIHLVPDMELVPLMPKPCQSCFHRLQTCNNRLLHTKNRVPL